MKSKNINIIKWELFRNFKLKTGITTRTGGVSSPPYSSLNLATHTGDSIKDVISNRDILCNTIKCDSSFYTHGNQVHGDFIHIVDNKNVGINNIDCDALVTNNPNVLLNIFVADCVPIIVYDPVKNVGGLCHCGWKGTYKNLLNKTILKLISEYESKIDNIHIGIGPSIGTCCYNVSKDLYDNFNPEITEGNLKNGKYYLNLKEINRNKAIKMGVKPERIEVIDLCTSCNNKIFYSYRKEGEPSGRFSCYMQIIS